MTINSIYRNNNYFETVSINRPYHLARPIPISFVQVDRESPPQRRAVNRLSQNSCRGGFIPPENVDGDRAALRDGVNPSPTFGYARISVRRWPTPRDCFVGGFFESKLSARGQAEKRPRKSGTT